MKSFKKLSVLCLSLCFVMFSGLTAHASAVNTETYPEISGKYFASDIIEAIENKDTRSVEYEAVLNDVLLPTSMGIEIPNVNPARVYQTVDVYTLDPAFADALSEHGIHRTSMSYSEYESIENTWLLPETMVLSIKKSYPELDNVDISQWTYGDYKNYCKERDHQRLVNSITPEQMQEFANRHINISDLHLLLKEFHTLDGVLAQSDNVLKTTLENAYQFTADVIGLNSSRAKAAPPANKYTFVNFPRYNNGQGDYFLNDVVTNTYWQNIQADRALKTQQVLYNSRSQTLCCTNMYGTYSYSQGGAHEGIDFVSPDGASTPTIYAVFAGEKLYTTADYHLAVYDVNSPDEPKTYSYLHMNSITAGSSVSVGDSVGQQGNKGNASGYHVHFEVHSGKTAALSAGNDHVLGSISPYRLNGYIGELDA